MFENQQCDDVEVLMKVDVEFCCFYQCYWEFDSKVYDVDIGVFLIFEVKFLVMKCEKFYVKD